MRGSGVNARAGVKLPVLLLLALAVPSSAGPTQDQLRADLQYVVTQLPALHPNLFFSTPAAAFHAAATRLEADIPQLSTEQFYTRLSALVAMAHDPHTSLSLQGSDPAALGFTALPLELRFLADGLFVTAAPANRLSLNRARLVHVNGIPIAEVLARLEPQIAHDNDYWLRRKQATMLSNAGILRGIGVAPATGAIPFGVQLQSGEQVTMPLSSDGSTLIPAVGASDGYVGPLLERAGENYWSAYWGYVNTLYIRYARCIEMPDRPMSRFTADTLALMDRNAVETVAIDLRGNGGGDTSLAIPLFAGIALRLNALRANPRFRVYTLIDGGTFSAAKDTAMYMKLNEIPPEIADLVPPGTPAVATILAGEPTGGKPSGYGEVLSLRLPQSRLFLQYSTKFFAAPAGIPDKDALYPDVAVNVRSTDYFARHDAVLAAVLARAVGPPAAPSGRAIVVNSASFRPETGIAAGSFVSAFGSFPAGDLRLTVNAVPAWLVAATPAQLVFVVPAETRAGAATLQVRLGADLVSEGQFHVTTAGPGLFVVNSANSAQPGAILNQDNALNTVDAPAARGSVLQIFATGYGPLDAAGSAQASAWIANRPAEILYSGPAPGIPGLWQINARIPDDAAVAKQVPVFIAAHGFVSNGVTVFAAAVRP